MQLLVLGGTRFTGRTLVARALERGHAVTVLHRGQTGADLFPEVERVRFDRTSAAPFPLAGRRFDAVVDFAGYVPRVVRASAEALPGAHYVYVSSISAYRSGAPAPLTEDSPRWPRPYPETERIDNDTYGPLKAACEDVVAEVCGPRGAIVRPGYIVGPWDPTDRFTSLVRRAAMGGRMVAPGAADDWLQFVDVRDLADFLLGLAERGQGGAFSAVHPLHTVTLGEVLACAARVAGADLDPVYLGEERLKAQLGDALSRAFPMYEPQEPAYMEVDAARAVAAGLGVTPVERTIADTLAWDRDHPPASPCGLTPTEERALLG